MARRSVSERAAAYLAKYRDGIEHQGDGAYSMPSASGPGRYFVSLDPRDCGCYYFGNYGDCKHLRVALILENESRGEEKVTITRATLARLLKQP